MNDDINALQFQAYRNSTEVISGLTVEDILKACLIGRLNVRLLSERGEGKSQILYDVNALFGNNGLVEQGRNDLTIRDIYKRLNLGFITDRQALKQQMKFAYNPTTGRVEEFVPMYDEAKKDFGYTADASAVAAFRKHAELQLGDLFELTAKIRKPLIGIDEITRCIAHVQNQFFNLFDGFITVDGVIVPLGAEYFVISNQNGSERTCTTLTKEEYQILVAQGDEIRSNTYSIGFATENAGNGKYVGTSEMDIALQDRMHCTLDLDYFSPPAPDTLEILAGKADPRVSTSTSEDQTERIVRLYEQIKQQPTTLQQYVALLYLVHGLDYLDGVAGSSKRQNKNAWPGCVQGHSNGSDAALIFPFSKRSALTTKTFAKTLEAVKSANGNPYTNNTDAVFDAAYLVGAQSGVLHPAAVDSNYDGHPYRAMSAVIEGIRTEFAGKQDVLTAATKSAQQGVVQHLDEFTGRFAYMKDILESTARAVQEARQ